MSATMGKSNRPKALITTKSKPKRLPPLQEPPKNKENEGSEKKIDWESFTDPMEFLKVAKEHNAKREFVFLVPTEDIPDPEHPTKLRIIRSSEASQEEFWNLSLKGLTHVRDGVVDFIPLDVWLHDVQCLATLTKIPFFKNLRHWRFFRLWKRAVQGDKMTHAHTALTDELFFAHSVLRPAFIQIQRELNQLKQMKLFSLRPGTLYTLESFAEENAKHREEVMKVFDAFFQKTLQIVQNACEKTMDKLQIGEANDSGKPESNALSPLDEMIQTYQKMQKSKGGGTGKAKDMNDSATTLKFTKKASRRAVCQKLVRFIRLVDYVIIGTLRHICFNALLDMFSILRTLHMKGSAKYGYEDPQANEDLDLPIEYQKLYHVVYQKTSEVFQLPVFRLDVSYESGMQWSPAKQSVIDKLESVKADFIDVLFKVPRLLACPLFRQYVMDDLSADDGQDKMSTPDLGQIIFDDQLYMETTAKQNELLTRSFSLLDFYSERFKKAIAIYEENCKFDIGFLNSPDITPEDVRQKIDMYREQDEFLRTIVDKSDVGVFGLYMEEMKQLFLRSPVKCLKEIKQELPFVIRRLLTTFTQKVQKAYDELTVIIDDVSSFVYYLRAVKKYSDEMPEMQRIFDVILGFQELAQEHGIYLSSDDDLNFQSLIPLFDEAKRRIAFADEQRQRFTTKYTSLLDKSISQLHADVLSVAEMANNPLLSSLNTTTRDAALHLVVVIGKTDEIARRASTYNSYQQSMAVQESVFDDVQNLVTDVGFKQLLWETKTDWERVTKEWFEMTFGSIDPSTMVDQLKDFQDRSMRAAAGLPENPVADELRAKIHDFANVLPIVSDLKNPTLKQQHIDQIVTLIGGDVFRNPQFKFGKLIDLQAFNFVEKISAISTQATHEQKIQEMLASVRNTLNTIQYVVNPCRLQKNAYSLEGTEDMLAQLDDAQATMNCVFNSKYIAPLRAQADDCLKPLRIVVETVKAIDKLQKMWTETSMLFAIPDVARQLPADAKELQAVDKTWRILSTKVNDQPYIGKLAVATQIMTDIEGGIASLEKIRRSVNDYLETKRMAFPRFYFLSNDELCTLIRQSRDPNTPNAYLNKIFDAITTMELAVENHIPVVTSVMCAEGEKIEIHPVKYRSNIEQWLANVEEALQRTMKAEMKSCENLYADLPRDEWIRNPPMQYAVTIAQMEWAARIEEAFRMQNPIAVFNEIANDTQHKISTLMQIMEQEDLMPMDRAKIWAVTLVDIHIRDLVKKFISLNVVDPSHRLWRREIVYKWDEAGKEIFVTQMGETYPYGFEYTGCHQRLLMIPQLQSCFENLSLTLGRQLGGCAYGPPGCGKTQSIIEMARALAIFPVVFPCGDSTTVSQITSVIKGVVQAGAWVIFQELGKLSDPLKGLTAEHLQTVRRAAMAGLKKFVFEGHEIPYHHHACFFATMSTSGTTPEEIPDAMKASLRPISFSGIAEESIVCLTLEVFGFRESHSLAKRLVGFLKNLRTVIPKKPHYSLDLRKSKEIALEAGALRHASPETSENMLVAKAVLNVFIPFLATGDMQTIDSMIYEVFPTSDVPVSSRGNDFATFVGEACERLCLDPQPSFVSKVSQVHEVSRSHDAVVLVGDTSSGKTTCLNILANVYEHISPESEDIKPVVRSVVCPNALSLQQLYGYSLNETGEWVPGALERAIIDLSEETKKEKWCVLDGGISPEWIDNLNTVFDENHVLTLPSGARISITGDTKFFFETLDLSMANPMTVTRACVVSFDSPQQVYMSMLKKACDLKIYPLFKQSNKDAVKQKFDEILEMSIQPAINFLKENAGMDHSWTPLSVIETLISIFLTLSEGGYEDGEEIIVVASVYIFAFIWSFGGHLKQSKRVLFDGLVRDTFGPYNLPSKGLIFDWMFDRKRVSWVLWAENIPKFANIAEGDFETNATGSNFTSLIVPTVETYRTTYMVKFLLTKARRNVVLRGNQGVGKTTLARVALTEIEQNEDWNSHRIVYTPKTDGKRAKDLLMKGLEWNHGEFLKPRCTERGVLFIDDLNKPEVKHFGAIAAFELLRQVIGMQSINVEPTMNWTRIRNLSLLATAGYDDSPRNPLPRRLLRHLSVLELPEPDGSSMYTIIYSMMQLYYRKFNDSIRGAAKNLSHGLIFFYDLLTQGFQYSADRPMYLFNMRDIKDILVGLLSGTKATLPNPAAFEKLWTHEVLRTFGDRINDENDRKKFDEMLINCLKKKINTELTHTALYAALFADYKTKSSKLSLKDVALRDSYVEYEDVFAATKPLEEIVPMFESRVKGEKTPIVLFDFFVKHVTRVLRILRRIRGHALLLGDPGTGKRTATKFSAFMSGCDVIELAGSRSFRDDLRAVFMKIGLSGKRTVLILGDEAMRDPGLLEDISVFLLEGDITTFYGDDDLERVSIDIIPYARSLAENESTPNLLKVFRERIFDSVHVCFSLTPNDYNMKYVLTHYPCFVTCCTINTFEKWPETAFQTLAESRLNELPWDEERRHKVGAVSVFLHQGVLEASRRIQEETSRCYWVTPGLLVQFLECYKRLADSKERQNQAQVKAFKDVMQKVEGVQGSSVADAGTSGDEPKLRQAKEQAANLTQELESNQKTYDQLTSEIAEIERTSKEDEKECAGLKENVQKELSGVQANLAMAVSQLKSLSRSDLTDLRNIQDPPPAVKAVVEVLCILSDREATWKSGCALLGDPLFLTKVTSKFNEDRHVSEETMQRVQPYIEANPNFKEGHVANVSTAAKCICAWSKALYEYEKIYKRVEPSVKNVKALEAKLRQVADQLKGKRVQAKKLEDLIDQLTSKLEFANRDKRKMEDVVSESRARMSHADRLKEIIAADERLWNEEIDRIKESEKYLEGDTFLCSAYLAYFGPLPANERQLLIQQLMKRCTEADLLVSPDFSFVTAMANDDLIQQWQISGLPTDSTSTENAIIARFTWKAPMMVDPFSIVNGFIKNFKTKRDLTILRPSQSHYLKHIDTCLRLGAPVLVEDAPPAIDPAIEPLIVRRVFKQDSKNWVKLGDRLMEIDEKFRIYLTTRDRNPVYSPDVFVKASVLDFDVTKDSLIERMLCLIVSVENKELEERKNEILSSIVSDKGELQKTKERMLQLMKSSAEHILDDDVLMGTIEASDDKRRELEEHLNQLNSEYDNIIKSRNAYRPVAERVALLFVTVSEMRKFSPLYEFSLELFDDIVTETAQNLTDEGDRVPKLVNAVTLAIYTELSKCMSSKHHLDLAFLIAIAILKDSSVIDEQDWTLFTRGVPTASEQSDSPHPDKISQELWNVIVALSNATTDMRSLDNKVLSSPDSLVSFIHGPKLTIPAAFGEHLSEFSRLIFVKELAPAKLSAFIREFVEHTLGPDFIHSHPPDLEKAFAHSSPSNPVFLIIEDGVDVDAAILHLAAAKERLEKTKIKVIVPSELHTLERDLTEASTHGEWILVKDIENSCSFACGIEALVAKLRAGSIHPDFRLILSGRTDAKLPATFTRKCVKVPLERVDGLKDIVLHLMSLLEPEYFAGELACRLTMSIVLFHALIIERQKFGRVGFRSRYAFNESDFRLACHVIHPHLSSESRPIPYEKMRYAIGTLIYGNRMSDETDRLLLKAILARCLCQQNSENEETGMFNFPKASNYEELVEFAKTLPIEAPPSIFGLHNVFEKRSVMRNMTTFAETFARAVCPQPSEESIHSRVIEIIKEITGKIPEIDDITSKEDEEEVVTFSDPLTVVLASEAAVFKQAITIMKSSLEELDKALKGVCNFTEPLNEMCHALFRDEVPRQWKVYDSCLGLRRWCEDLGQRVEFFNAWIRRGRPVSFWLQAFSDPKAFLAAVIQRHIEQNSLPQTNMTFDAEMVATEPTEHPETGVFVHGLLFEGAKWNYEDSELSDPSDGEACIEAPWIHLIPVSESTQREPDYFRCPVLSIVHSDSEINCREPYARLITTIPVRTTKTPEFWTIRGASLLLSCEK